MLRCGQQVLLSGWDEMSFTRAELLGHELAAGGKLPLPFEKEALGSIYRATKGLPRDVIKVSNSALTHAYANRQKKINLASARFALAEHHLGDEGKEGNV